MDYKLVSGHLSIERLDGEVIAIDFRSGKYGSFIGPSADIMWLLQTETPRSRWYSLVSESFPKGPSKEAFNRDIEDFMNRLAELQIIEEASQLTGSVESLPEDYERAVWSTPVFAIQDDLVELLVIDPIHDTSDDGWPQTKPE